MRLLAAKTVAGMGIAEDDNRKENTGQQISQERLKHMRNHILSFPAYSSHYTREKSSRLYLSSDLNIRRLYELYQDKCSTDNLLPVHYNSYRIMFHSLNLSFRKPKMDTCGQCDRLQVQITTDVSGEKDELQCLLDTHQSAAQRVYEEKKKDILLSRTDTTLRVASFDLQKQLPTPYLTCGQSFYSRQLYTYNLTIFSSFLGENTAYCYLWDESKARRGSQEIGSCLLRDLNNLPETVETIVYYSDRCTVQNNNKNIVFLLSYFIEMMEARGRKLSIVHKFMHTGHSHMEVDSVHAAIEKAKKKTNMNIEIPHDWAALISNIRRRVPFLVMEMDQKEFLNIKALNQRYYIPKTTC